MTILLYILFVLLALMLIVNYEDTIATGTSHITNATGQFVVVLVGVTIVTIPVLILVKLLSFIVRL